AIVARDALGSQDLLRRHRKEGARLHCGVISDQHAASPGHATDAGHDAGRWRRAPFLVHLPGGPKPEFEDVGARIKQAGDAFASRQTALLVLAANRGVAAAELDAGFFWAQVGDGERHAIDVLGERAASAPRFSESLENRG